MITQFLRRKKVLFLWLASLVANIITVSIVYFKLRAGSQTLALRFNFVTGVNLYGKGYNLYWIPAIGLIILIANFTLYRLLKQRQEFLAQLTAWTTLLVHSVLMTWALFLLTVN